MRFYKFCREIKREIVEGERDIEFLSFFLGDKGKSSRVYFAK